MQARTQAKAEAKPASARTYCAGAKERIKAQAKAPSEAHARAQTLAQVQAQTKAQAKLTLKVEAVRARQQSSVRTAAAAADVRTLPVFRLVARCTEPKPPSPMGSGAISQRTLSSLNLVSLPLPLELLPPPKQPMVVAAKSQNTRNVTTTHALSWRVRNEMQQKARLQGRWAGCSPPN